MYDPDGQSALYIMTAGEGQKEGSSARSPLLVPNPSKHFFMDSLKQPEHITSPPQSQQASFMIISCFDIRLQPHLVLLSYPAFLTLLSPPAFLTLLPLTTMSALLASQWQ